MSWGLHIESTDFLSCLGECVFELDDFYQTGTSSSAPLLPWNVADRSGADKAEDQRLAA